MDGANKFVRGDAIAGIIITLANIIGGLAIGVFQNKMSFANAAQTYTLLTIGDGLVTQIPALIISTSAGIIVSRAGAGVESGRGNYLSNSLSAPSARNYRLRAFWIRYNSRAALDSILGLAALTGGLTLLIYRASRERKSAEREDKGKRGKGRSC